MREGYFATNQGEIFFRDYNHQASMAIIFLHGNSMSGRSFENQVSDPSLAQYRLIIPDLPGHGNSTKYTNYSIPSIVEGLSDFCNSLDCKNYVLVGHSLGGHFAIQSLDNLEKCLGLFLFGTPPLASPPDLSKAFLPNPVMPLIFKAKLTESEVEDLANAIGPTMEKSVLVNLIRNTDPVFREQLADSIGRGELVDELGVLKRNNIPTAILHGKQDLLVNGSYLEQLDLEKLWEGRIHFIPNAGHSPHLEAPGVFNKLLERFIQSNFLA